MKHLVFAVVAVSLGFSMAVEGKRASARPQTSKRDANPKSDSDSDARAHEGVWKPVAAVLGGVRLPDQAVKAITLTISGENYEVAVAGEDAVDKGTVTLDKSTSPKRMTIKSTDGPNKGKTFLAIYEMQNKVSMRVCYDLAGKEFPKDFKAPKGTQFYAVGYRRQTGQDTQENKAK